MRANKTEGFFEELLSCSDVQQSHREKSDDIGPECIAATGTLGNK